LSRLADDRRERSDWLRTELERQMAGYRRVYPAASGADGRIADHFAALFATGMLGKHYGVVDWSAKQIAWAVRRCELAHLEWAGQSRAKFDPVAAIRSYIRQNLADFRKVPDPSITDREFVTTPGFIYTGRHKAIEYVIAPPVLDHQLAHIGIRRTLGALDAAGFLVRTGDKYVSKVPIRSSATDGRKFAYRIRASILSHGPAS
jgi:hypothetical protein